MVSAFISRLVMFIEMSMEMSLPSPNSLSETEDAWHWGVHVTASNLAVAHIGAALLIPCLAQSLYTLYSILFGTLYPAYASYKAVKTKNVKEYVKWMMYWIVFALFSCVEALADLLMSFWCPFYYELKILFLVWLLSPATKGSSVLYRKFVHPQLNKREKEIDEFIARAKDQGYSAVLQLGSRGFSYATAVVMQTALKGQATLVNHLRKSYSMTDLVGPELLRPALHYAATLPEVDSQMEDFDSGLEEPAALLGGRMASTVGKSPLRWQSEVELPYEDDAASHSDDPQTEPVASARTTALRSRGRAEGSSLRRTNSVRASKSSSTVGSVPTSTGIQGKTLHEDVSAYATMPRTKSKVARKKQPKTM